MPERRARSHRHGDQRLAYVGIALLKIAPEVNPHRAAPASDPNAMPYDGEGDGDLAAWRQLDRQPIGVEPGGQLKRRLDITAPAICDRQRDFAGGRAGLGAKVDRGNIDRESGLRTPKPGRIE